MGRRTRIRAGRAPLATVALALLAALSACGGGDDATPSPSPPTPTPAETVATTPTSAPTTPPRVIASIEPSPHRTLTVVAGTTIELNLDLFDAQGQPVALVDLPRLPTIGWYVPRDGRAAQRQYEARGAVAFEGIFRDGWPPAPLAGVAGSPAAVRFTAPLGASGQVLVRAVVAAADCSGGRDGTDPHAAAVWDGPCSAEFAITIRRLPPEQEPCHSIDCIRENLCRGFECIEADADPWPCRGFDCIEAVPNALERRIFEPGERIDWNAGIFLFRVETGRTEAYRLASPRDTVWYQPSAHWVEVAAYGDWNLLLHRETGRAWRWARGTADRLASFLREEVGLEYQPAVAPAGPMPPSEPDCPGLPSPDGHYVAQQWGEPGGLKWHGVPPPSLYSEPSVVVVSGSTCEPLFRVRPAYSYEAWWTGEWLANGEGFVLGVEKGYAIARVSGPDLVYLPAGPPESSGIVSIGPVPAPTGGDRYFLYDFVGVYDRQDGDWSLTRFPPGSEGWSSWGETHEEVWYQLGFWDGGWATWNLSPPTIEYPPFEEVAFRVRQMDGCLDLREEPHGESEILECLPQGERVTLEIPPKDEWSDRATCGSFTCFPATRTGQAGDSVLDWVYVRSGSGTAGWLPYGSGVTPDGYLEHD